MTGKDTITKLNIVLSVLSEKDLIELVENDGSFLQYVETPTYEICISAVNVDGLALEFVDIEFQDYEMCLQALRENKEAVKFILDYDKKALLINILYN